MAGGGDHHADGAHGHGHGGGDFRTKVWTMSGGPNCRPLHWKRNTAIAMAGIFLVCIPIAMKSAQLEVRFYLPIIHLSTLACFLENTDRYKVEGRSGFGRTLNFDCSRFKTVVDGGGGEGEESGGWSENEVKERGKQHSTVLRGHLWK